MQTNLPNGISLGTATANVDGVITGGNASLDTITAASGSVFGSKVAFAFGGSAIADLYTVGITSALYDSGAALRVPFSCVPEIIQIQGATAGINRACTVHAGSVSTATIVCTLAADSANNGAAAVRTTIGATAIGQGSFIHVSCAVTATANSAFLMVNLIPTA